MNQKINSYKLIVTTIFFLTMLVSISAFAAPVNKMTKEELKLIMANDNVTILDVRQGRDWNSSEFKIVDAVRVTPEEISNLSDQYPKDNIIVLYCA